MKMYLFICAKNKKFKERYIMPNHSLPTTIKEIESAVMKKINSKSDPINHFKNMEYKMELIINCIKMDINHNASQLPAEFPFAKINNYKFNERTQKLILMINIFISSTYDNYGVNDIVKSYVSKYSKNKDDLLFVFVVVATNTHSWMCNVLNMLFNGIHGWDENEYSIGPVIEYDWDDSDLEN